MMAAAFLFSLDSAVCRGRLSLAFSGVPSGRKLGFERPLISVPRLEMLPRHHFEAKSQIRPLFFWVSSAGPLPAASPVTVGAFHLVWTPMARRTVGTALPLPLALLPAAAKVIDLGSEPAGLPLLLTPCPWWPWLPSTACGSPSPAICGSATPHSRAPHGASSCLCIFAPLCPRPGVSAPCVCTWPAFETDLRDQPGTLSLRGAVCPDLTSPPGWLVPLELISIRGQRLCFVPLWTASP